MDYYHDLITAKSWRELQNLTKYIEFVLIGGWATYLYTKALKSKDIDIIADFHQLPLLKQRYQISKNDRLRKYEARLEELEIDIYLPHYSSLGVPIERVLANAAVVDGFRLPSPDYLILLKLYVLSQRIHTAKGRKDFLDLLSLFSSTHYNDKLLKQAIRMYRLENAWDIFSRELSGTTRLPELSLTARALAGLKRKILV